MIAFGTTIGFYWGLPFTFMLKRQNRRVYLVAFLDDHNRYIVGYGLHASQSTALVLEVLRAAIAGHGSPEEILTDNGTQYVTWRGKSAFSKELHKRGIKQIVAAPRHPQTLGKIERFWGSLWRECLASAVFVDLGDAQRRLGWYIDHYNFQRAHQGLDRLVPADRFFGSASAVRQTLQARVAANPWGKGIVIVALTGWGQEEDIRRSNEAGFDHHMVKPVDPATLEKLLAGLQATKA